MHPKKIIQFTISLVKAFRDRDYYLKVIAKCDKMLLNSDIYISRADRDALSIIMSEALEVLEGGESDFNDSKRAEHYKKWVNGYLDKK